jgi:hypothetical protein
MAFRAPPFRRAGSPFRVWRRPPSRRVELDEDAQLLVGRVRPHSTAVESVNGAAGGCDTGDHHTVRDRCAAVPGSDRRAAQPDFPAGWSPAGSPPAGSPHSWPWQPMDGCHLDRQDRLVQPVPSDFATGSHPITMGEGSTKNSSIWLGVPGRGIALNGAMRVSTS